MTIVRGKSSPSKKKSLFLTPPLQKQTPPHTRTQLYQDRIARLRSGGHAGGARGRGTRAVAGKTTFAAAVTAASAAIDALALHVRTHRAGYSAPASSRLCSERERDRIEAEAGRLTRDATAGVEGVRVLAASAAASASAPSSPDEFGNDPGTAAAAAAYRAGVALALSERLQATSGVFDRARAARYAAAASEREGKEAALRSAAARASSSLSSPSKAAAAAAASVDFASSAASPSSPSQQGQKQLQMQAPRKQTANSATAALLAEISSQQRDVARAEATARELASLNRAFAGAVATQAEAIEALFESALVSVANVERGNVQLRKANAAGAGARRWVFIALLVAALGILLADWLSS